MNRLLLPILSLSALFAGGAAAKTGRTYYDPELLARIRAKVERHEWAKAQVSSARKSCEWLLAMSDDELWGFVPPPGQLRALNVAFGKGCPVHGKQVFRKGGHYPWIMSRDRPFKVKCRVGGEEYPSNDFEGWTPGSITAEPESGPGFVDKGAGWVDEKGIRYFFVAHHVFWQRWQRDVLPGVRALANAYLLTGEPACAHKCAVLLAKIANDYADFDYPTQAYHHKWPTGINGRILDYIWETGTIGNLALAYDAIHPALAEGADPELAAFLKGKGIDDLRPHVEQRMLRVMAEDVMRGFIRGNVGMYQRALCFAAIVFDNDDPAKGPTTAQMRDWIMTGSGDTEYVLWNSFYRDGHGGESSPGYSAGWCANFYQIAELLPRLGVDIWSVPKAKKMADIGLDLCVAGVAAPAIGDSGTIFGGGRPGWTPALQGRAFARFRDPRHAAALTLMKAKSRDLFSDLFDEDEVASVVAQSGTELGLKTRDLGGYGLAVLEAGREPNRRGVSMYYGFSGGGHGHFDRLTIEMIAFGRPMLTDMGYPAHWLPKNTYWTSNTVSHYCVVVDEHRQETMNRGCLNTLVGASFVQLMDASAEKSVYASTTSLYRRTAVLVDAAPERSYLLDVFRVHGGRQHDYSFHGPPFPEFTVSGAEPGPVQQKGTLLGEDVEFGGVPGARNEVGPYGLTLALRETDDVLKDERPYAERGSEGWASYYDGNAVLTRKPDATMTLKIPRVPAGKVKFFLRAYDYDAGVNVVEVRIGDATAQVTWEPSGAKGFRWVSAILDLPAPSDELTMRAAQIGQSWVLIKDAALSTNLATASPRAVDLRTSGFQYLFNVRRMRPGGAWSATWRDAAQDLALTMTMPAGAAQEVILADAEPELKPGHPDTLQYVLARNVLGAEVRKGGLRSAFVAVAEPHRGAPAVKSVDRMAPLEVDEDAVGVIVRRDGAEDLIHSSLDAARPCRWRAAGAEFAATAEFALVSVDQNGVKRACLLNGSDLRWGDFELHAAPSPAGKVTRVDYKRNTVTIDVVLAMPEAYADRVLIVSNDLRQTSYTIEKAVVGDGETTLHLGDVSFLVQMGYVEEVDAVYHVVKLGKIGRVDGGFHEGRWLCNEDKSVAMRIVKRRGKAYTLEGFGRDLDGIFADPDGDGRRLYWVSDIGVGDDARIPAVATVERLGPNVYKVNAMTSLRVTLPQRERAAGR